MDTADGPVVLLDAVEEAGATPRDGEAARRTRGTSGGAARRPGRAARSGSEGGAGRPVGQELQAGSFIERWLIR